MGIIIIELCYPTLRVSKMKSVLYLEIFGNLVIYIYINNKQQ